VTVRGRGSADDAVVVVKLEADEGAVTYLRVKLPASDCADGGIGGEGRNMLPRLRNPLETIAVRSAIREPSLDRRRKFLSHKAGADHRASDAKKVKCGRRIYSLKMTTCLTGCVHWRC
jgi:hypothetical protein